MESEFMRMQREATEQLRRMQARATPDKNKMPPPRQVQQKELSASLPAFGDSDKLLLLGLLFLLYRDGSDPLLMLALLYLLM